VTAESARPITRHWHPFCRTLNRLQIRSYCGINTLSIAQNRNLGDWYFNV